VGVHYVTSAIPNVMMYNYRAQRR